MGFPHTPDDHKNKSPEGRMEHEVKWVQINAQVLFSPRERLKENARKCKMSVSQLINEMITSTQIDISPGMPAQIRDLNSWYAGSDATPTYIPTKTNDLDMTFTSSRSKSTSPFVFWWAITTDFFLVIFFIYPVFGTPSFIAPLLPTYLGKIYSLKNAVFPPSS